MQFKRETTENWIKTWLGRRRKTKARTRKKKRWRKSFWCKRFGHSFTKNRWSMLCADTLRLKPPSSRCARALATQTWKKWLLSFYKENKLTIVCFKASTVLKISTTIWACKRKTRKTTCTSCKSCMIIKRESQRWMIERKTEIWHKSSKSTQKKPTPKKQSLKD